MNIEVMEYFLSKIAFTFKAYEIRTFVLIKYFYGTLYKLGSIELHLEVCHQKQITL